VKLKIIATALCILSLNVFAANLRSDERGDQGWIIPESDRNIGVQNDNWSCGAYAATKFLNAFNHWVDYGEFKNHYSQKVWGNGGGNVFTDEIIRTSINTNNKALLMHSRGNS
jgi:hypothetical protein